MNFLRLFAACCFFWLLNSPVNAQYQLPVSLQPYTRNLSPTVVGGLHRMGFKHHLPASGTVNTDRSNTLRLDSTKTFYGYGIPTPTDSTVLFRSHFTYPNPDEKVETNAQFENGAWMLLNRSVSTFDQLGRTITVQAETFDPVSQTPVPDSWLEAYPHKNSTTLIDSFFVWQWNPELTEWRLLIATRNVFDEQEHLLESNSILDLFGQSVNLKDVYTYDNNGDNTLITSFISDGVFEFPTGIVEMTYTNHLLMQVISSIFDQNNEAVPQSKSEQAYNSFNQISIESAYEWSVSESAWIQTGETSYTYDAQQRLSAKENAFLHQNEPAERERFVYHYKEDEHLALEETYFWDGSNFWLSDRLYYYYSEGTSLSEQPVQSALLVFPNPTRGTVTLQLNDPATIEVFNATGMSVKQGSYQPHDNLILEGLPAGSYFIHARTEKNVYTGRIIKE